MGKKKRVLFVFNPVLVAYAAALSCSLIPVMLISNLRNSFLPPTLLNYIDRVPIIMKILLKNRNSEGA